MKYTVDPVYRRRILNVLKRPGWHTFREIRNETDLDIRKVMGVTGHAPYDIIGTRQGYKLLSKATDDEIQESLSYLEGKIYAMRKRATAIRSQI